MTARQLACTFLVLSWMSAAAFSQVRADLRGRILDSSGAAVPNARVELIETAKEIHRSTTSSSSGDYVFESLNPGDYRLEAVAAGFQNLRINNLTLAVGQTATVDLTVKVGANQQELTVYATPPFQSQTSNIQTNVPTRAVVAMPLNSRNFVQLTTLAPGVAIPPGTVLPRINGGRPRTNEYLYDGISALQPEPGQVVFFPIIDDIQEFTVEANNVAAEFGRFNGGVVNVATRSGSNELHGSLCEFSRNEALNAHNYFARTGRKPEYRRNLYGGTLGAPIVRNRLFVFAGYQGVKQLIGLTPTSTVPTLAERQGIFTGVAHIFDPTTTVFTGGKFVRQEFPNDVINVPMDPAALKLLSRFPEPTNPSATANNYTRTANDADHQNQFDVRVDGRIRGHDRAFGRYSYFHDVEQPVTPFPDGSGAITGAVIGTGGVNGLSNIMGQQAVFNETHTFSDHVLNDLRFGYTRRGNASAGTSLIDTASSALGIPGIPTNAAFNNALPLFTITGFQQLSASASTSAAFQTAVWELVDGLSYSHGSHTVKGGVDFRWYQLNSVAPPNPTGAFAFAVTGTNQQGVTGSGNALASFLLGQVDNFQIDLQEKTIRPRDRIQELYLQDDWRVTHRLTFNLGARWTLHFPSTEASNQGAVFNLQTQQLDYLGKDGFPRSARELHYGNIAPRVGLAFLLTPKVVIRSGYGIVFIDQSGITTPFTIPQFPFIQNVQQKTQDNVNPAFALSQGPSVAPIALTPDAGFGQSAYTVTRDAGSGYVQQWNLAVQRQLTNSLSFEVAYIGSHIAHVGIPDSNLNQLTSAQLAQGSSLLTQVTNPYFGQLPASSSIGGKTVTSAQLLKPYPRFLNVAIYRNNTGSTNYNAVAAKVEQRFNHGLYLLFSYTHSKLIDAASAVFSTTVLSSPNSNSLVAADTYRPWLERDSSNGDMTNVTSISTIYELPAGRGHRFASSGVMNKVFGGWVFNALASLQSGMPVTVTQATNFNSFAGFSLQRPTITGNPTLPADQRTTARFFNTSAFTTTPQFAIGNASRNPVRGPAYRDLDLALVKHTRLSERTDLEFRAEVFDFTNTPAFAQPNGSFGSPAFGTIAATTTDPRVIQFALRLSR